MKRLRERTRSVSLVLVFSVLSLGIPYQSCLAALVGTGTIVETAHGKVVRERVKEVLSRKEVRAALKARGISLQEANARVDALNAEEVSVLEKKLEQLPAGGDALGTIVFAGLFVFIVLLVTDILGYTDVFPFVTKTATE
jgi:hypothetical protein